MINKKISAGFTLIELLIVAGIISVITSLVLVSWNTFREIRVLDAAGLELVSKFREVRSKAISGEKPVDPDCAWFDGYQIGESSGNVSVTPLCRDDGGNSVIMPVASTIVINLEIDRTFSGFPIVIESVTGTNDSSGNIGLEINGRTGNLIISASGDVTWQRD